MAFLPMGQPPIDPNIMRQQLMFQLMGQQPQAQGMGGAVGQGLQTLAQALAGRMMVGQAQGQFDQYQQQRQQALQRVMGGAGVPPEMAADMQALGAEDELVGALAGRMFPKSQSLMKVGQRVFDPNTREWVTEAPEEGLSAYEQERLKREDRRIALAEQRANRPPKPGADPLVEVYDPESPTGTRLVPRSQAAGKAGRKRTEGPPQVGSIPAGHELYRDPDTGAFSMRPIPGSPAELEQQEARRAASSRQQGKAQSSDIVLEDIGHVMDLIEGGSFDLGPIEGSTAAGPLSGLTGILPGSRRKQAEALVATIKANIGFDRLQAMRESSPTGGALGQVTERELNRLEAVMGNLDLTQPMDTVKRNLQRIADVYQEIIHGPGGGVAPSAAPDEAEEILKRYGL